MKYLRYVEHLDITFEPSENDITFEPSENYITYKPTEKIIDNNIYIIVSISLFVILIIIYCCRLKSIY